MEGVLYDEDAVNNTGYLLATTGQPQAGLFLLRANTTLHPQSLNVYDSMGEIALILGDKEEARTRL